MTNLFQKRNSIEISSQLVCEFRDFPCARSLGGLSKISMPLCSQSYCEFAEVRSSVTALWQSTVREKMAAAYFSTIPCEPNTANRHMESNIFGKIPPCTKNNTYGKFEVF